DKDISLYINSPGGSSYAGMAIYDALQFVKPDVQTVCVGMGMSAAAMILCGGAPGKRFALPNAKIMIHQGSGGFLGTPADIQLAAACEHGHRAPDWDCACGIYAAKRLELALPYRVGRDDARTVARVVGLVALGGDVIEHRDGFRASLARPLLARVRWTHVGRI